MATNVWRTDIKAFAMVNKKKYQMSYGETLYALDQVPRGYIEIPLGRKVHQTGSDTDAPQEMRSSFLTEMDPLTPVEIYLQCTPVGSKPPFGYGYVPNKFMKVFSGYAVSPWVSKRRGGQAVASITAMGEMMKLATSAPYLKTLIPDND
jgi:hypothetical protein